MKAGNRFKTGSGVYRCSVCNWNTRDTGGDGSSLGLCDLCYDLSGEENSISDSGTTYESAENVKGMLSALDKRNSAGTARKCFADVCNSVGYTN